MPGERSSSPSDPALIGREAELAQLEAFLAREQPGLIVLTGETGLGKSSLLKSLARRADKRGWKTVPGAGGGDLSVGPDTSEETFVARVRELLDLPTGETGLEAGPELTDSGLWKRILLGGEPEQQVPGSAEAGDSGSARPAGDLRPLHPLVEQLRRRAPILVTLDGYRPENGFTDWLLGRLIPDIRRAEKPLVVVIADRPADVSALAGSADLAITLGPLEPQAVRHHFEALARQIQPPMEAAEIEAYVKAACQAPETINDLTNVLLLAQSAEP